MCNCVCLPMHYRQHSDSHVILVAATRRLTAYDPKQLELQKTKRFEAAKLRRALTLTRNAILTTQMLLLYLNLKLPPFFSA